MPSKFEGQFFEFVHERMTLVDAEAKVEGKNKRIKVVSENKTECPFIIDKKESFKDKEQYKEYPLSETGAFILRFVLEKVSSDLIAQIYKSQYGVSLEAAEAAVDGFIYMLLEKLKLLKPARKLPRRKPIEPLISNPRQFLGLHLDFSVGLNQMNKYKIKTVT